MGDLEQRKAVIEKKLQRFALTRQPAHFPTFEEVRRLNRDVDLNALYERVAKIRRR